MQNTVIDSTLRMQRKWPGYHQLRSPLANGTYFSMFALLFPATYIQIQCKNTTCKHFEFHNPSTPLDQIPYEVQIRHSLKKSAKEDGGDGSLLCPAPNCKKAKESRPRDANRACTRAAPHCAACCREAGGCNLSSHRLANRDLTTAEANMQSGSSSGYFSVCTVEILNSKSFCRCWSGGVELVAFGAGQTGVCPPSERIVCKTIHSQSPGPRPATGKRQS